MKKRLLIGAALFTAALLQAQMYAPASVDRYVTGSTSLNVQNTGSDSWSNVGITNTMHVMVSDGTVPSFGWSNEAAGPVSGRINLASSAGINSIAKDPDVAIDAAGTKAISVFYTLSGTGQTRVYFQRYSRASNVATVWTLLGVSTPLTALSLVGQPHSSPNIEISNTGRVAVVFAQNGRVYSTVIQIATGVVTPAAPFILSSSFPPSGGTDVFKNPDVAVYTSTGGTETANVTYVRDDGSFDDLYTYQVTVANLSIGSGVGIASPVLHSTLSGWFSAPRIACLWTYAFGSPDFWTVVVGEHDPLNIVPDYIIYNVTSDAGVINGPFQINNVLGTEQLCPNTQPCVTYSGDYIVAAWTYTDCGSSPLLLNNTGANIIARKLTWNGNIAGPWAASYSQVNADLLDAQTCPSLSDCRFSNNQTSRTRYCWYQNDPAFVNKHLAYRWSAYNTTNLRLGNTENETTEATEPAKAESNPVLNAFPNPASTELTLNLALTETDNSTVRVFSADGKMILDEQVNGSLLNSNYKVNTENWADGIYLVRIQNENQIWTSRVVVKH